MGEVGEVVERHVGGGEEASSVERLILNSR